MNSGGQLQGGGRARARSGAAATDGDQAPIQVQQMHHAITRRVQVPVSINAAACLRRLQDSNGRDYALVLDCIAKGGELFSRSLIRTSSASDRASIFCMT